MLIRRLPWRQQPPAGVQIAPEWARRVRFAATGTSDYDIQTGRQLLRSGAAFVPQAGQVGMGLRFSFVSNVFLQGPALSGETQSDRALVAVFRATGFGGNARGIVSEDIPGWFSGMMRVESSGALAYYQGSPGPNFTSVNAPGGAVVLGRVYVAVGVRRGTTIGVYMSERGYAESTYAPDTTTAVTNVRVGVTSHNGTEAFEGEIFLAASIRGTVSDSEARSLVENPWQLFRPLQRRIYSLPATGPSGITGTSTATLASVTGAAAGTVAIAGASTATLADVTGTAAGTVAVSGASTATVAAVTGSATGSVVSGVVGSSTATLGSITGTAAGTVRVAGASAQSVGAVTGTAAGQIIVTGLSSATLAAITGSATGAVAGAPIVGASAVAIAPIAGSATGVVANPGAFVAGNPDFWLIDPRDRLALVRPRSRVAIIDPHSRR